MNNENRIKEQQEQDARISRTLAKIKNKLIIMSGKGGVGKSTVAVNIAVSLAEKGLKTGLMDIDFHGPNTLKMLNLENKRVYADHGQLAPLQYSDNLKVFSIAAMLEHQDSAVVWRGPLKMAVIKQFLADVDWQELDCLVIDSPPGTGDEPLSAAQLIPGARAVIVTTPQEVSLMDVRKSINFCDQIKMPVAGLIENMSGLSCPHCGKQVNVFKTGGGKRTAEEAGLNFLGAIPLAEQIAESGDSGIPYFTRYRDSEAGKIFSTITDTIIKKFN